MDIVTTALLALIAGLALIGLLVPVAERLSLPLPTVLVVVGLAIGGVSSMAGVTYTDMVLDSYDAWFLDSLAINSDTLLLVFMPPLLFEMALAVDVRRLQEDLAVVMLMAVVAVIAATLLVGGALFAVSDLTPIACLLLGATISTTDPAAVVTIFRKLGAPKRLLVILEGESLLNDAAAIAIFSILIAGLAPETPITLGGSVLTFLQTFSFGAISGFLLAYLIALLYPWLRGSALAETSLTVALAYATFLIAEFIGASGVVAVVIAGLATSVIGDVRMGPRNWPQVTAVWEQIGFWANGLILLIGALIAPSLLSNMPLAGIGYLIVVVFAAFAARALILFGMLPAIARLGLTTSINQRQKTLVWWGGVRGALTLILTLSLAEAAALGQGERALLGALGCSFVLVTLLVNAASLARVTQWLGLDRLSDSDRRLRERIVAATMAEGRDHVLGLAQHRGVASSVLVDIKSAYRSRLDHAERQSADQDASFGERLRVGLTILAAQEKRLVRRRFEDGIIGITNTRILRTQADRLADATRIRGREGYEAMMADLLAFPRWFRVLLFLQRWLRLWHPLARLLARRFDILVEIENVLSEIRMFNAERMPALIGEDVSDNLQKLLDKRAELVRTELEALELQYPNYAEAVRTASLSRVGLRWEAARYSQLFRDGVVGDKLHRALTGDAERLIRRSRRRLRLDMGMNPETLISAVPLFQDLEAKDRRWLSRRLKSRLVAPGETVVNEGERGYEMYFIASGALEVRVSPDPVKLKTGDFFGELALLGPARRRNADVVALGFCRLLVLRRRDVVKLVASDQAFAAKIRGVATARARPGRLVGSLGP
ncbi:MAG: cation:proton antiporter [Geminicoccaceae bacterium]